MRILLDTHAFIWWNTDSTNLSAQVLAIFHKNNSLLLSAVSIWEMQIKVQSGKLQFATPLRQMVVNQQRVNKMQILSLRLNHIYALEQLPHHHKDPFDRLLVAQAIHENIPIVTHDPEIAKYNISVIW